MNLKRLSPNPNETKFSVDP